MLKRNIGFIGFSDILGYSRLIEKNDVGDQLILTLKLISEIPEIVRTRLTNTIQKKIGFEEENSALNSLSKIKNLVVSDSILTFLDLDSDDTKTLASHWTVFMIYMQALYELFFDEGLPLRGAISAGEFIVVKNSFAGKPIIDSYRMANNMNQAGIILDIENILFCINKNLKSTRVNSEVILTDTLVCDKIEYVKKNGVKSSGIFLKCFTNKNIISTYSKNDFEKLVIYITKSFCAFNKDLDDSADIKLINTISFYKKQILNSRKYINKNDH